MIVSWMTTNQCNLKCVHCYQDAEEATDRELSTDEAKKMIDEIAKAGFKIMIFSGGEPLLRPDIYELVAHAASCGLRPVFGTNGTLITDEVAQKLKEAGACAMGISVDSLVPEKHDKFRGLANAYELTRAGIEACKRAGLPFQLHTTVVDWNRDEVCSITDFAEQIGAQAHYIFFLIPVGRGEYIQETSLEVLENEALLREIMAKSAEVSIDVKPTCAPQFTRVAKQLGVDTRFSRGCLAGLTYCVVGSEGIVRPCAYMTEEAGDVRMQPFDEIWKTSPVFERLRTQAYSGACGTCDYKDGCGGTGLPKAPSPLCRSFLWASSSTRSWKKRRTSMKRIVLCAIAAVLALALVGCGQQEAAAPAADNTAAPEQQAPASDAAGADDAAPGPVTFTDDLGNEVTVDNPQRVVACMGSFANAWELAGGTLVGVSDDALTAEGFTIASPDVATVGDFASVNLEAIIALDPDFVIMTSGTGGRGGDSSQADLREALVASNIPVAYFEVTTFDDYLRLLRTFADITGREDCYNENGAAVAEAIEAPCPPARRPRPS